VVVLAATKDMCMMRNPKTLTAKARFKTAGNRTLLQKFKDVAREPGVPGIFSITKECYKMWQ